MLQLNELLCTERQLLIELSAGMFAPLSIVLCHHCGKANGLTSVQIWHSLFSALREEEVILTWLRIGHTRRLYHLHGALPDMLGHDYRSAFNFLAF
jgi:hypothetical protein